MKLRIGPHKSEIFSKTMFLLIDFLHWQDKKKSSKMFTSDNFLRWGSEGSYWWLLWWLATEKPAMINLILNKIIKGKTEQQQKKKTRKEGPLLQKKSVSKKNFPQGWEYIDPRFHQVFCCRLCNWVYQSWKIMIRT